MSVRNLIWWIMFTIVGVGLQWNVPGVDFLLPGLLVALQEHCLPQLCWVMLIFILIQEGLGSLHFGGVILWYLLVLSVAGIGYRLFHVYNWFFILITSIFAAISHYAVITLMCSLQALQFDSDILFYDCLIQALITPLVWKIADILRHGIALHENSARS